MNAVVYKLIKKEIKFTFRPLLILGMLLVTFFIQIFKIFMAQGGAIVIPMMWCWLFSLSGTIKGYGAKSIGMFVTPVKRTEYVTAKYIFSIGATLVVLCMSFIMDAIMLGARDMMIRVPALLEYNAVQMVTAYAVAFFVVTALMALMLYGGACSRVRYDFVVGMPIMIVILFVSVQDYIFKSYPLAFFKNTDLWERPVPMLILWGISIILSAGMLLLSYKRCMQDIQKIDL